jgi:hypothetical protein
VDRVVRDWLRWHRAERERRHMWETNRVHAAVIRCEPIGSYSLQCESGLRARRVFKALDELLARGDIVDRWVPQAGGRPDRRVYVVNQAWPR